MNMNKLKYNTISTRKKGINMNISIWKKFSYLILTLTILLPVLLRSQDTTRILALDDAIAIARQQSPDALTAKHRFRVSYWQFKSYRASYLPSIVLSGYVPDFNKSIQSIPTTEGTEFYEKSENWLYAGLSIKQKIGPTGGILSLNTDLGRLDNFIKDSSSYASNLLNITYQQPLFQYNEYKWERKLEPIKYTEAKKKYLEEMEDVALTTANYFFNLLEAQIRIKIAEINEANYDTLFKIAQGRYNLGKIAENELLQLELQYLRASAALEEAGLEIENQLFQFKSYLRIKDGRDIQLLSPSDITPFFVNAIKALEEARENSSTALSFDRRLMEAKSEVDRARLDERFDASLYAVYGLSNSTQSFQGLNVNPSDNQQVKLGITLPILDWGVARGKIKMAQSNQEIVRTSVEQEQLDFNQEIYLKVARFNLQYNQVLIAAKSDTVAQKGYDITKARYLIGKISITDLNIAQAEADNSKQGYYNALGSYWRYFYELRKMTLYDFKTKMPIMVDFDELL